MLRELKNVQQVQGEPKRRWFYGHDLDLVVWEDEAGHCVSFQLAYDKQRGEHSIAWTAQHGYSHYVVDDGEPHALANRAPLLYADGVFERDRVLETFLAQARHLPAAITAFVADKLRAFG
jgi:hypothetical protein